MSSSDFVEGIRPVLPATAQPAEGRQNVPATSFAQLLEEARQQNQNTSAVPAPTPTPATAPAAAVAAADEAVLAAENATSQAIPFLSSTEGYVVGTRYHPYAQAPARSLPEPEQPGEREPRPEPVPDPLLSASAVGLRHPRGWGNLSDRAFLDFSKKFLASGRTGAGAPEEKPAVAVGGGSDSGGREGASGPPDPNAEPDVDAWFGERGYDPERFLILADLFVFNVLAMQYIGSANGVRLSGGFMTDPEYLDLGGCRAALGGEAGGESLYPAVRACMAPGRVATRAADFAIALSRAARAEDNTPPGRRAYAEMITGAVGRAYGRTIAAARDRRQSRPLLRQACLLFERRLREFARRGPDPDKNAAGGLYEGLRAWAGARRVYYHHPRRRETDIVAENLRRAGVGPTLDATL